MAFLECMYIYILYYLLYMLYIGEHAQITIYMSNLAQHF